MNRNTTALPKDSLWGLGIPVSSQQGPGPPQSETNTLVITAKNGEAHMVRTASPKIAHRVELSKGKGGQFRIHSSEVSELSNLVYTVLDFEMESAGRGVGKFIIAALRATSTA